MQPLHLETALDMPLAIGASLPKPRSHVESSQWKLVQRNISDNVTLTWRIVYSVIDLKL